MYVCRHCGQRYDGPNGFRPCGCGEVTVSKKAIADAIGLLERSYHTGGERRDALQVAQDLRKAIGFPIGPGEL